MTKSVLERLTGNYAPQTMVNELANSHLEALADNEALKKKVEKLDKLHRIVADQTLCSCVRCQKIEHVLKELEVKDV